MPSVSRENGSGMQQQQANDRTFLRALQYLDKYVDIRTRICITSSILEYVFYQ